MTFGQTINNEVIATEIVRTLVGSIALVLSVPVATVLAVRMFVGRKPKIRKIFREIAG